MFHGFELQRFRFCLLYALLRPNTFAFAWLKKYVSQVTRIATAVMYTLVDDALYI